MTGQLSKNTLNLLRQVIFVFLKLSYVNNDPLPRLFQVLNGEHKMNKPLDTASLENNTITNLQTSEPRQQRVKNLLLNEITLYSNLPRKQVRQSAFRYYHILCKKREILLLVPNAVYNKGPHPLNTGLRAFTGCD